MHYQEQQYYHQQYHHHHHDYSASINTTDGRAVRENIITFSSLKNMFTINFQAPASGPLGCYRNKYYLACPSPLQRPPRVYSSICLALSVERQNKTEERLMLLLQVLVQASCHPPHP